VRFRFDRRTIKVKINTQRCNLDENISNPRFEHRRKSRRGSGRVHGWSALAELLKLPKSGQFPDEPVRIKV
jgi:hypothetical protein